MKIDKFNILVVEDDQVWQEILQDALRGVGCHVDLAADFSEGKRKVANNVYDLVLLDVGMDQPGFNALCQQFCQVLRARLPDTPFLAMSGKNLTPVEMATLFRDYRPADFIWKATLNLSDFQRQIKELLRPAKQSSSSLLSANRSIVGERSDVPPFPAKPSVIVLTVNKHETNAVLDVFLGAKRKPSPTAKGGVTYNHIGTHGGCSIIHAICEMGAGSIGASQQRTRDAIEHWKPVAVIPTGIAFGIDEKEQQIGDVLISTHIQDYELGRLNETGKIVPRAGRPNASDLILSRLRATDAAKSRTGHNWPKVRFGLLLTGQKLLDNLNYRELLKEQFPEAIGGDMEAYGVYVSAEAAKVDWIVIKAICDWGHHKNNTEKETWQKLAANNAARVLKAALDLGNLYTASAAPRGNRPI